MMANNNEKLSQKKMILELYTTLLGVKGTAEKGLVGDVKEAFDEIKKLNNKHNKLSLRFWILVGVLSGSGILGANQVGLLGG